MLTRASDSKQSVSVGKSQGTGSLYISFVIKPEVKGE